MYHLRRIKVLLAACVLACSSLFAQDVKVTISSATTDSQHTSYGPGNAIDGDYTNHWHSGNNSNGYATTFPVRFTIKFSSATRVDYVRYNPRTDSSNGNWGKVKVEYCSSVNGTSFVNVGTYDLNEAGSSHDFYLNGVDGVTCGQIRFTIESGYGGWATASEIEAYQIDNTKPAAFAEYFNGDVYSELKPGVTSSDGIADADVKALVDAMLAGAEGYKKFRVGEYEPYMTTATVRNNLKTNSLYNNYENPTGIYLKPGESCIVAVSGIGNYPVGLKIKDWYKSGDLSTYRLRNGLNYITATTEGNVFVDYYTDDFENAPNVQMHFINAPVLGYWDQATMTNADWEAMLRGPLTEDEEVIIITRSEHAQTAYPVKQWKTYCPANVDKTMTYYQQVQWAERDILGLEKFGRQVKNRQLFYADKSGSMYAGGDASVCGYGDLRVLVTPDAKVFDFWGVGHEWGHNNQMAGFHWSGCGETTNNIPASWAQFKFTGNRDANENPTNLRLEDEVTGINDYKGMRGGRLQTYFEEGLRKGVQWQLQDGPDWHAETPQAVTVTGRDENGNDLGQVNTTWRHYDHFVKLAPFWQLNLWGTVAEKNPYIITKVIEAIRTTDNYTSTYNTNGKQQINWMKLACQAAEMDLLPFFEKAGMLRPIHAYVDDYAKGWNIITEEMINELKASVAAEVEAGRYQAYPDEEINYINGHNYHIYRDNSELNVTSMEGERNGDKVTIQHSVAQNAVAFETYNAQDELIRITMYGLGSNDEHSFTQVLFPSSFDESENAAYIMAVGYDGERQRVYQTYANEDEAKYGELGRILTGVEAMKALCNDTKVGYYKSSALTDLNAAYDIAKAVYDNKESAKYAAVYDMLNTEFMKVQNDATARVGIVEGNAYRLENKGYTGRYMSINSEKMIVGETTELTDAQKWYFEASDAEGYYYIKNKSTQTYPGNVETSTKLYADKTTSSEAHAYKLQDMGNGLWALVGGTGLHQGSSVYDYGIVGWGADADASQWYITVVETNTNAEALNNLQVLVDKAEALIAEIEADGAYSTISTSTAQSKVDAAKDVVASGTYNESVYTQLNEQYTALLNAKKSVDDAALDAKKQDLSTLIGSANSLIAQCGTVESNDATPDTELALQTSNPNGNWYVSTNADNNHSYGGTTYKDGEGIAALVDDNTDTYFHTRWQGESVGEAHYIQVDMGEGKTIQEFVFSYTPRSGSPAPTAMTIYGSNDASSFTQVLATITSDLPAHNSGKSYTSSTINSSGAAYRYLRFVVTGSAGPAANTQYGGQYFFGMMEFDITEKAKPESYTVTLGNEAGDVTEELLLTAYKAVQEAQSVVDYANTEAQVNEAIEKLQAQYQALEDAKKAVRYQDYAISALITESNVTVVGGGVVYKGQPYTTTLTAPNTLTPEDLDGAIEVEGYEAMHVVVSDAEIVVTYNKRYTVQVIGGKGNGGVTYNGHDYANGEKIYAPASFATSDLTAIVPTGYTLKDISIEDATVKVSFKANPLVDTEKYYTLECRSDVAHKTERFIRVNGSVINGRSSEGSLFQFEAADDDNGYYIKSYVTGKYINHADGTVYASVVKATIWTMDKPSHTPEARTLTVGNNLYLNNNGSDCTDNSCDNLQSLDHTQHGGAPGAGNACSLWTLDESVSDKSGLSELIGNTLVLMQECQVFENSAYVTDELLTSTSNAIRTAQDQLDKELTLVEYEAAKTALQTVYNTLNEAKEDAIVEANERTALSEQLRTLITETETLIASCYENDVLKYVNSVFVTEESLEAVRTLIAEAKEKCDNKGTTANEYNTSITTLTQAKSDLVAAIENAKAEAALPVDLTIDTNTPILYVIKTKREGNSVLQYESKSGLFGVTTVVEKEAAQAFYFMAGNKTAEGTLQVYIYPYLADGMVLAANDVDDGHSKALAMDKGTATYEQWVFVEQADGYYNLQPAGKSTYLSNYGGTGNKMGFYKYSPAEDKGSLFKFESTTVEGSYYYLKLKDYYENQAKVAGSNIQGGEAVGYYPTDKANAYNSAYSKATDVLASATLTDEEYTNAYDVLKAANEALEINMPEEGKYYVIRSAHTGYAANKLMYATGENAIRWDLNKTAVNPEAVWTFTSEGYLENLNTGCAVNTNGGEAKLGTAPKTISIKGIGENGQVLLTPAGGTPLHADWHGHAVSWGTYDVGSASAWRIVEVEDMSLVQFALTIGQYRHASLYLNYATKIPAGVKVFVAHTPNGDTGEIIAEELIDATILPAKTAVIVQGDAATYNFTYTTGEYNGADETLLENNRLGGSAYLKYQQVEKEGNLCCVFGRSGNEVGLYKNYIEYIDANGSQTRTVGEGESEETESFVGTDNGTHFKIWANKIYFEYNPNAVANASAFRFRFIGSNTTLIDGLLFGSDTVIYNLYGQRIVKVVVPGFYIVNGKKMYVSEKMIQNGK